MRFEHYTEPVLPLIPWLRRIARSVSLASVVVGVSLLIGVLGYHTLGHLNLVDSILEASMILGGMGPVAPLTNDAVKLFASAYALYSGLMLIGTTGILLAPWLHRMFHYLHQAEGEGSSKRKKK
ncbi:MAG: hypothetical protein M3N08_06650 [Pseudomonadota bacterium]|nr:hypothetical protein [Pseudomonadota bacterium]